MPMSSSSSLVYHYHIYGQDAIPVEEDRDYFSVEFDVDVQYVPPLHSGLPVMKPFSPFQPFSFIPCEELIQLIPRFIRSELYPFLCDSHLDLLTTRIISFAQSMVQNRHGSSHTARSLLLPLLVEIQFFVPYEEEEEDLDMVDEVLMVPTTKEAVSSLKKVKVVNGKIEGKHCSICLEEIEDDEDVLAMPCDHVFHSGCIVEWLKTSHMCPICRYQMPVE